ncbi:MAG: threonine ammonia-lyase [Lachnospirales bacterium]
MNSVESFKNAMNIVESVINKTDLIYCNELSCKYNNNIYLKPENFQKTGSYKIRGAYYKISLLTDEEKSKGLITSSAGNHAQGVAYAAKEMNIRAKVVMPTTTPLVKVNRTKSYGAEVILHGDCYDEASDYAKKMSLEEGYTYIHPFNDLDIATGQGTIAYEILKELPEVDVILVPIGGGGLSSGVSTLVKMLMPHVEVIGVEPVGAASMKYSIEMNKASVLNKVDTIADGVAVKAPGDKVFPYIKENISDIILIDDNELIDAFLSLMENHKMIVEYAGLLTVAALEHIKFRNKNVVSILSGGNMDVITMASLVQHGLINRGRIFTFGVYLPDRPGELVNVANIISKENGNIIKLDHNQFVSINRNKAVELVITLEAFGHDHKNKILKKLKDKGYEPVLKETKNLYD